MEQERIDEFGVCAGGSFRLHVWQSYNTDQYRYAVSIEVFGVINWWNTLEAPKRYYHTIDQALEAGRAAMSRLMSYYEDAAP